MSALLVVTAGQTDVQIVECGVRKELRRDRCAELHAEIERRPADWRLVDAPEVKESGEVTALPNGHFDLCTPKLDAVLAYVDDTGVSVTHALVFDTTRDATAERGDPRYAGSILERRLNERKAGTELVIRRVTYLSGAERLEDRDDPRDVVIRRVIVNRIDDAVRSFIEDAAPQRIVVAATGGMPAVGTLVEEIVRLHAGKLSTVELMEVADGAKAAPQTADRAVPRRSTPEPVESFRARRHALDLIESGNLLGAWGAVRHLHGDDIENLWTRVVAWLSCFAASLPLPAECDLDVLSHRRMAVRTALRVELSLRAGDIPRAVHGTVAFFEAALWDHLAPHLVRHADPKKRRLYRVDPEPEEKLIRSADGGAENLGRPFEVAEVIDGIRWYKVFDDDVCGTRLAKRFLHRPSLTALAQAVSKVRDLRNDVAHNEPTPAIMSEARSQMVAAGLWSPQDTFLTQPLVANEMADYGLERPNTLANDLIDTVRARLVDRPPTGRVR